MRVVQAGLGQFGRNWFTEVLVENRDVEVVGLVEPSAQAMDALRAEVDLGDRAHHTNLNSAIEALGPDAVVVTASLPAHVALATTALNAGCHVLMEKPLAPSVEEAKELVRVAERAGRVLMVSQNYRFFPAPRYVRSLIADGTYGELGDVHVEFRRNIGWSFDLSDPLIVDVAIHHFDLMRMICGADARRLRCTTWNPSYSPFRDPPCAEVTVEMTTGTIVTYRGSLCSRLPSTPWGGTWNLELERAGVRFSSFYDRAGTRDTVEIHQTGGEGPNLVDLSGAGVQDTGERSGSLRAFVRSVTQSREPETAARLNVGSVALMHAALESSATGEWVEVEGEYSIETGHNGVVGGGRL